VAKPQAFACSLWVLRFWLVLEKEVKREVRCR
jgi:hypothetical protein